MFVTTDVGYDAWYDYSDRSPNTLIFNVVDEVSYGISDRCRAVKFVCSPIVRLLSMSRSKAESMSILDYFRLDALFIVICPVGKFNL